MAIKFKFCFLNRHFALGLGRHLPLRRLPTTHSIFIVFVVQYVLGIHKAVNPLAAEKNLEAGILDSCVGSHKVTFMYVYVHAGPLSILCDEIAVPVKIVCLSDLKLKPNQRSIESIKIVL